MKEFRKIQDERLRRIRALVRDAAARRDRAHTLLGEANALEAQAVQLRKEYNSAARAAAPIKIVKPRRAPRKRRRRATEMESLLDDIRRMLMTREQPVPATK